MKHILYICLLFYSIHVNAQHGPLSIEDKKMDAVLMVRKPAILTIKLKNLPDSVKKVGITYAMVQLGAAFQADHFTETNEAGDATIVLEQNLPYQQLWVTVGDYLFAGIYVNSGLVISLDVSKLPKDGAYMIDEGVNYSGADGELNTVMNKHVLFRKPERKALHEALRNIIQSRKKYSPELFTSKVDSVRKELTAIDQDFISDFKDYGWAVNNETLSEIYGNLCVAYWGEKMPNALFNEIKNHQPYFTSNEGVLFYSQLGSYTRSTTKAITLSRNLIILDSLYTQQKADVLKLMLLGNEKDVFSNSYSQITASIQTQWAKKIARNELTKANINQKKINKLLATSAKIENPIIGIPLIKMPFDAELYKIDDIKNADDFLLSLKQKFPHKALIIDFWATWCAPCLADLPSSKKLHERNKDLDVEYIYLCTSSGSSLDVWKKKLTDLQIPGTHFFMSNQVIAQLKSMLNATGGFPAYVAIDIDGKINPRIITRMGSLNRESLKEAAGL